ARCKVRNIPSVRRRGVAAITQIIGAVQLSASWQVPAHRTSHPVGRGAYAIRALPEEKPRLPKKTGPEADSVRPLKSPVSPSAPPRTVPFGSAPGVFCALGYYRRASRRLDVPNLVTKASARPALSFIPCASAGTQPATSKTPPRGDRGGALVLGTRRSSPYFPHPSHDSQLMSGLATSTQLQKSALL